MFPEFNSSFVCRAPLHPQETERLASVCGVCHPEKGRDRLLDQVADGAARLFDAPIGLVTFVAQEEQWFGGRSGLDLEGTPREESFCAYAILQDVPLVVEDATKDPRFSEFPLVTQPPHIRSYVGVPVMDVTGLPLGSICVLDFKPLRPTALELAALERLATTVGVILETRRMVEDLLIDEPSDFKHRTLFRLEKVLAPLGQSLPKRRDVA